MRMRSLSMLAILVVSTSSLFAADWPQWRGPNRDDVSAEKGLLKSWLNGGPNRGWFKHIQGDGRVTLLVLDPKNMFRWAQIQGRLASSTAEGADDHIERLSQRYTGGPYRNPKVDRLIIRVDPERVTGFESGQPWDVTV